MSDAPQNTSIILSVTVEATKVKAINIVHNDTSMPSCIGTIRGVCQAVVTAIDLEVETSNAIHELLDETGIE